MRTTIGNIDSRSTWGSSFFFAFLVHLFFIFLLLIGPVLLPQRVEEKTEVRLVRLAGGGENRPGFVKPTTAPPDNSLISDGRPKPLPVVKEEKKVEPPPVEKREEPKKEAPAIIKEEIKTEEKPVENTASSVTNQSTASNEENNSSEAQNPVAQSHGETGEGVGNKPGPEGPGIGARSDADFPGAEIYLSRLEAEVQSRFNFRGRGSGVIAEYHFYISKRGKIEDLVLMKSSGISSLDLAARSAILRARLAPLPPGFKHQKLGVTYIFHDDK